MNREYALAAGVLTVCTAVCVALYPFLALANLVMIYLLGTLIVARRGHRGPAVLFSAVGVLCFDFFFVPPRFSFSVADTQYIFTFLVMFSVAVVISDLTVRIREEARSAKLGESKTAAIHGLGRKLAQARGSDSILNAAVEHIEQVFHCNVIALAPGHKGLEIRAPKYTTTTIGEKELSVAYSVFKLGRPAGAGTDTLPAVEALFVPLTASKEPTGVLRVFRTKDQTFDSDELLLIESFAQQIGLALEIEQTQLDMERERLRSSLLSSISHDLRTPLAAIIGSASSLLRSRGSLGDANARELLENIQDEGERLSRLVHNLIETTRLEAGAVRLRKEPHAIEEIVGSALERLEKPLAGRTVLADLPEDLPLVPLDSVLMEQVFINLLENASRHTPPGTAIEISAREEDGKLRIAVSDHGPGLASDELERVFEKFYHAKKASSTGVGLGLAICRAVIDAHGGRIWAENRPEGGAVFRVTLPLEKVHA